MRRYIIGSGYIGGDRVREDFAVIWQRNLLKNKDVSPMDVFVICARGEQPGSEFFFKKICVSGDLGHIRDIQNNRKDFKIEGWPTTLMTLGLIAYSNECDLLFIEQDCLPFGNFVSRMYGEIRDGVGCIMGNVSIQPCAQSLMLIRHWFIPELVHGYLGKKISNNKLQGEQAFEQMEREMAGKFQRFTFGWDRDRNPKGFADDKGKVFYVQQVSVDELAQLKQLGLIV